MTKQEQILRQTQADPAGPEIRICPVKLLRRILDEEGSQGKAALISTSFAVSQALAAWQDCLLLRYEDIDREIPGRSLSRADAARAAAWILQLRSFQGTVWFCCDSGISRSSAMAAAACRIWGREDLPIWRDPHYSPNPLVYEAVCTAAGLPVSDPQLDFRMELSRRALREEISRHR